MFARLYQSIVIGKPKTILALLVLCLLFFGYYTKDFKLDASSDTLLIENDPDLKYLREITDRYGAKEFLILTFTPKEILIPNILKKTIIAVTEKIIFESLIEILAKKLVITDLFSSLISILSLDKKFKIVGNNVKVIIKDVIRPKDIIQPKSMIGFISLKIKDRKAHIVVRTV